MPEGHTIHRLARDQRRDLRGRAVEAASPQGRFAEGAARIDGATPVRIDAWGKHLFHHYDTGDVLHVHLGLIGKFRRRPSPPPEPVGVIRLRLSGEERTWDLSGPAICALVSPDDVARRVASLGPDPLRRDADPDRFVDRVRRSAKPIGALLLDQAVIAGIGNVYRAEMLFLAGIHPEAEGRTLTDDQVRGLWDLAVTLLTAGVRRNRIVTVDPAEVGIPLSRITRADAVYAYHRAHCIRCGDAIERLEVAGRRIDACPTCQPRVTARPTIASRRR